MNLVLSNTLGRRREAFKPLREDHVGLYTCGPTVYNYVHIGNLRTFVWEDILRRTLTFLGYDVTHVMNITDVDDKTIRDSKTEGISLREFTERYTEAFFEDIDRLNVLRANHYPRATEFIPQMVDLIRRLQERGHTYQKGGAIYYDISTFPDYGKLSGIDISAVRAGARVDQDEYEKQDARDFALWKETRPDEPFWETAIGKGRPGWHIECSAMSMAYLGESFDIHTGAVDNIFPHHENEIAQSEGATGKPFVHTWLHAEHLIVEGEKMSKSKGNFYTLRDLLQKGYDPLPIRYLFLSVPYKKKLNFTFEGLKAAGKAVDRLAIFKHRLTEFTEFTHTSQVSVESAARQALDAFTAALSDDLNTAEALAALFNFVRTINAWMDESAISGEDATLALDTLRKMNDVLDIFPSDEESLAGEIETLIREREEARRSKDFARSDAIRDQLEAEGIILEDTPQGTKWRRKR